MKKISELQGDELRTWQADYSRREQVRQNIGRATITKFQEVAQLPEDQRQQAMAAITQEALDQGATAPVIEDILIKEFKRAALANRDSSGANLDVKIKVIDANKIVTPKKIDEWGNNYRINPIVRESYLQEMRQRTRKQIVVVGEQNEPAGRVSIIYGGPIAHPDPNYPDPPEAAGKPTEEDVIKEIGEGVAWVEDLAVLEGYRKSGVGIRLMYEVEEIVRQAPDLPQRIGLAVRPDNSVAIRMYEQMGYQKRPIAGQETFVTHIQGVEPHEDLLMVKDLQ